MSIFWIIFLAFLTAGFMCLIAEFIYVVAMDGYDKRIQAVILIICAVLWILFIFAGIGMNTEDHRLWVAQYEAEKRTIEAGINSETLSGLERIDLVNKAAELNGELAYRKEVIKLWHHIVYGDKTFYDGVEMIQIK